MGMGRLFIRFLTRPSRARTRPRRALVSHGTCVAAWIAVTSQGTRGGDAVKPTLLTRYAAIVLPFALSAGCAQTEGTSDSASESDDTALGRVAWGDFPRLFNPAPPASESADAAPGALPDAAAPPASAPPDL